MEKITQMENFCALKLFLCFNGFKVWDHNTHTICLSSAGYVFLKAQFFISLPHSVFYSYATRWQKRANFNVLNIEREKKRTLYLEKLTKPKPLKITKAPYF